MGGVLWVGWLVYLLFKLSNFLDWKWVLLIFILGNEYKLGLFWISWDVWLFYL